MPTTATALTPDELDAQAARLHDTEAWQRIVTGWDLTVPEPPGPVSPGAEQNRPAPSDDWRDLLSVPVDQLIADTVRALPAALPRERPSPGVSVRCCPTGSTPGGASDSRRCGPPSISPMPVRS